MILKDFGKSDNDLGVWVPFGEEVPPPFEVRVRRIPNDVATKISKRYGRETVIQHDGIRRPHVERSMDEYTNWLLDQAAWAWVDARGLQIEVADEAGAQLWAGLLKKEIKVGELIDLSGPVLTDATKKRILQQVRPFAIMTDTETLKKERVELAAFLVREAARLAVDQNASEKAALGNS